MTNRARALSLWISCARRLKGWVIPSPRQRRGLGGLLNLEILRFCWLSVQQDLHLVFPLRPATRLGDVELSEVPSSSRDVLARFVHNLPIFVGPARLEG